MQILELPQDSVRPRYTVNFFEYNGISYVAVNALYDFVACYHQWAKKKLGHKAIDWAIIAVL